MLPSPNNGIFQLIQISNSASLSESTSYDYVIIGAGCAGLSLLMRMLASGQFQDKKILLVDKAPKTSNDRTWCFWETQPGFFEPVVYRKWDSIDFLSDGFSATLEIKPYQYKMIRGIDFYDYCFNEIRRHKNISILYGDLADWTRTSEGITLQLDGKLVRLGPAVVFDSIYRPAAPSKKTIRLLQHFKGWVIEAPVPIFDPRRATLMDFRVHQDHGTAFAYILPFSDRKALVEYTLFTRELLSSGDYDRELRTYIKQHIGLTDFEIIEEEFGIIPMTNEKFSFGGRGWNIGAAGGQTKASSGYTFQFIQKNSQQIVDCLVAGRSLDSISHTPARFRFYDHVLLHILYHEKLKGKDIFTRLFQNNETTRVLAFLDNESTLRQELKIISSLPAWPFLRAAISQL